MNHELAVHILRNEYRAVMAMLKGAIRNCPDELWDQRGATPPIWQIAYHALAYTAFYVQSDPGARELPWHDRDVMQMNTTPDQALTRAQLQGYARGVGSKVEEALTLLKEGDLAEPSGMHWTGPTVAQRLFYNLRHTSHHIGEINIMLTAHGIQGPNWVGQTDEQAG